MTFDKQDDWGELLGGQFVTIYVYKLCLVHVHHVCEIIQREKKY